MVTPYTSLRTQPRMPASALLCLPVPLSLFIEPTNFCNFKCKVCPESLPDFGKQAGYHQAMARKTFEEIVAQFREWGVTFKTIRLYGMGEPLVNDETPWMVAAVSPFTERTEITTNGSLLALKADQLLASGLDYLKISVYGTTVGEYRRATGSRFSVLGAARVFREKRDKAGRKPWISAYLVSETPDETAFRRQWADVADDLAVAPLHNWGTTEGLVQLGQSPETRIVCPKPFYELYIRANGDVSPCCVDWDGRLKIGNVMQESLKELWEGPAIKLYRNLHLTGNRCDLSACRDCSMIYQQVDDMDGLAR